MKKRLWPVVSLVTLLTLAACGGGGGSSSAAGGGDGGKFDGSWGGTIEDPSGALGVITLTFSGSSMSGSSTVGGAFSGTITQESGNIWGFTLSDGTEGGFMHDPSVTRAVFVDEFFNFGVVQKGASGPAASYAGPDIVGSWAGTFATVDGNFVLASTGTASATINSDTTFFGSSNAPDSFNGEIGLFNSSFGRWIGASFPNISSSLNGTGVLEVFLTSDKQFAGSYACFPTFSAFPAGCSFNMWNRN